MSYNHYVLQDYPRHFFPLGSGATTFADIVSNASTNVYGTPAASTPLVVGGGNSLAFTPANNFRFATDLFAQSVTRDFTLEAWFKPVDVNGQVTILGHRTLSDGISYDGERITFGTRHGAAGSAIAEYYPPVPAQAFCAHGVHTSERNELYVNGVLVAGADITEEMRLFGYEVGPDAAYLYSGVSTTNTGTVLVDSLAVYPTALSSRQVKLHFLSGRDVRDYRNVVVAMGGSYWELTDDTADVGLSLVYDSAGEWSRGLTGASVISDQLLPMTDEAGVTVASTWEDGLMLGGYGILGGSKIEWDADGTPIVEVSTDNGTSWVAASNHREIPGVGPGTDTASLTLLFRILFLAGETNSISKVRRLSITLYRSKSLYSPQTSQFVNLPAGAVPASEAHQPIENYDWAGAYIPATTTVTNPEAEIVRTVEMWVKAGTAGTTLTDATGTRYVNGVSGAALPVNDLAHVVYVLPANDTDSFTLGNNSTPIQVAMLATYDRALTAAEVTTLYNSYLGVVNFRVNEAQKVKLTDAATDSVKVYSYDWSVVASG